MRTLYNGPAVAIREKTGSGELFMGEDDAGEPCFGPFDPRTILLHPDDEDTIGAALNAAPDGCQLCQVHLTVVVYD